MKLPSFLLVSPSPPMDRFGLVSADAPVDQLARVKIYLDRRPELTLTDEGADGHVLEVPEDWAGVLAEACDDIVRQARHLRGLAKLGLLKEQMFYETEATPEPIAGMEAQIV